MGQYILFGEKIVFDDAAERFFDYQYDAWQAMKNASAEFSEWYYACGDISTVLRGYENKSVELVVKYSNEPLFDRLTTLELYDISKSVYDDECLNLDESSNAFDAIAEKYNRIISEQEAEVAYRAERKDSRGRVVGGGFGVGGALKGMAAAGAMNAVAGAGHSIANAIGNAGSAIAASSAKKALYNNVGTLEILQKGITNDILDGFNEHMRLVNERKGKYIHSAFDSDRAGALFENAKKVSEKETELLVESFRNCPWNEALLEYIFVKHQSERRNVWDISKRYHVSLLECVEDVLNAEYTESTRHSEEKAQEAKKRILAIMEEIDIEHSAVLDTLEQDCLTRICIGYESSNAEQIKEMVEAVSRYDALDENKRVVIHDKKIWELASAYQVEFSSDEIEAILSGKYNSSMDEIAALEAKAEIRTIMQALGAEDSDTLNQLEQDCVARLCEGYQSATEEACNMMIEKIIAYDALEKNKKPYLEQLQTRIETIWAAEDGEIFDNVFMKTDITNAASVAATIEFIKSKGRTASTTKYLDALEKCTPENIKKAKTYQKGNIRAVALIGIMIAVFGAAICLLLDFGFVVSMIPVIIGIALNVFVNGYKKVWKTMTLNGTLIHATLLPQKHHSKAKGQQHCKKCNAALEDGAAFCTVCGEKQ